MDGTSALLFCTPFQGRTATCAIAATSMSKHAAQFSTTIMEHATYFDQSFDLVRSYARSMTIAIDFNQRR
jgi:hypothetical protein